MTGITHCWKAKKSEKRTDGTVSTPTMAIDPLSTRDIIIHQPRAESSARVVPLLVLETYTAND